MTVHDEVVWPLSRSAVAPAHAAPRRADLRATTIAFLWHGAFRGDEIFDELRRGLSEAFGDVRFVDHAEFGNFERDPDAYQAIPERLRHHGVDAAIVGVGG